MPEDHPLPLPRAAVLALPVGLALALTAAAEPVRFPARLAGHAVLPAETFVAPPADAPEGFAISGRFTGPGNARMEELHAIPGQTWLAPKNAPRFTGLSLPFAGQPVQGFSGVSCEGDGTCWALSDNGFGSKANSVDALLMVHRIRPDWQTGEAALVETLFLSDPDRVLPFPIATEFTDTRYLTGADLDIESVRRAGDLLWFGDEFGPFLVAADLEGRVVFATEARFEGKVLRSPDNPRVRVPSAPGRAADFAVPRSRGFEGMALSVDGQRLFPMLEGPVPDPENGAPETRGGRRVVRILAFDLGERGWTGESWLYPLEAKGHAIGDFTMISERRGLVIERDGGEGVPALACPKGEARSDCFAHPARFKRVYLVELGAPGTAVEKIGHVDLMDIADTDRVARQGGRNGRFAFPFVTVEAVDRVDAEHILVGNDNNLPFSSGRTIGAPDDNEWILLHVGGMLD